MLPLRVVAQRGDTTGSTPQRLARDSASVISEGTVRKWHSQGAGEAHGGKKHMKRMKVLIGKRRVMVIATLAILVLAAAALAASSASFTASRPTPATRSRPAP